MIKILDSKKKNFNSLLEQMLSYRKNKIKFDSGSVVKIVNDVKRNGDKALLKYEKKFTKNFTIISKSNEIKKQISTLDVNIKKSPISPDYLGQLILLIISDKISGKIAKNVFEEMFNSKKSPNEIVKEKSLIQVSDTKEIEFIIDQILDANKDKVSEYKSGKTKLLGFFVGQSMKTLKMML